MSEVLEKMKSRRSVRKYKPDPIPQEVIDQIMESGMYAANGMGYQNTIPILLYYM
ncbi:MAG: nitroreductase family protein [Lachnospiraceae bacterium]|nr:nitroreductase family protein [Lachnospiraceae bacterium]